MMSLIYYYIVVIVVWQIAENTFKLRIEGLKENYRFVQANVRDTIDRLVEMVNAETGDISDTVRLNAINSLLQYSFKITEQMDILERLEILEGKVKENG